MKNHANYVQFSRRFALSVLVIAILSASPTLAMADQPQVLSNAVVNEPVQADVSPPLRDLPVTQLSGPFPRRIIPVRSKNSPTISSPGAAGPLPGPMISATVGLDFEGVGNGATNNCPSVAGIEVAPSDANVAVGDTQVVQWVNLCLAVFDKATGALLAGPFPGNHFWAGFSSTCSTTNDGDPIIQWDKANHVWVASQNVFSSPFLTCIAISTTADATGTFNRFAFPQSDFPDYPKWRLTPSVYYQTQNAFASSTGPFLGVNVCAYDAVALRAGNRKAMQICEFDNANSLFDFSLLPADTDSDPSSSSGPMPEVLLGSINHANPGSNIFEYVFTVNFKQPKKTTLAGVGGTMPIAVPSYSLACGGFGACIPQPSAGSELLDSLGDRLMYRLALFDDGITQHFLVTHSVNDTAAVAARWYEFRAPHGSTALTLFQSGQTPDDGEFRWMGSVAYDKFGDIALAYSRSSAAAGDFPSIYLSGQTAGEPAGTTDAESLIFKGAGSQSNTQNRWGDYTSTALDGADMCTFWYTDQYYSADGSFTWQTRVAGNIKFPSCP